MGEKYIARVEIEDGRIEKAMENIREAMAVLHNSVYELEELGVLKIIPAEVKADQGFLSLYSQAGRDDHANDQGDRRCQTKTAEDDHNQRKNICRNEYTHEEHSHLFQGKIGEQKGPGR